MQTPLERRKPVVLPATGLLNVDSFAGDFDRQDTTPKATDLEAFRVRKRFPALSWPVARVVAHHVYGGA